MHCTEVFYKEQDLLIQIRLDNIWVLFLTDLHSYANPSHAWAGAVYTNCKTFPIKLSSEPDKMPSQKAVCVLVVVTGGGHRYLTMKGVDLCDHNGV